jgi:hydrogenase-4 component B
VIGASSLMAFAFATYLLVVAAAIAFGGRLGRALVAAGSAAAAASAGVVGLIALSQHQAFAWSFPRLFAFGGLVLHVDGLSAFFLIVLAIVAIPSAIYGFSYTQRYDGRVQLRLIGSAVALLLLAMTLTVTADNALTFLVGWELASLSAYLIVLTDPAHAGAVRAANWYLAVTHAGFAALIAMFFLLSGGDVSASFDLMRGAVLGRGARNVVFLLALFGFGAKSGLMPLHVWLPMAHPVAPSHGSALMSGLVIKLGVYGFVRVVFDVLGPGPAWWGGVVLAAGAVSALLGVLYALMEHDLKRLLAYHSVENIGIIFMGLGGSLLLGGYGLSELAVVGAVGGLYHTMNHAAFKGLLFLCAGAVQHAAGTINMDRLGGLIRRMPWTAVCFLIGAAAISALPPLNGFASEWLVFQTLLAGIAIPRPEVALTMPLAVGLLALTGGLASACFVKAFGITFLAIPRSEEAARAHEVPLTMRIGTGLLVIPCVLLGVAPFAVARRLVQVATELRALRVQGPVTLTTGLTLQAPHGFGRMSPPVLAIMLVATLGITLAVIALAASRRLRVGDTWGCGRIGQTPRMQYTASAFAEPLRRVFAEIYRPTHDVSMEVHPESKYFVRDMEYRAEIYPWFERRLYGPLIKLLGGAAERTRRVQHGLVHVYLLYMAVALIVLLVLSKWL